MAPPKPLLVLGATGRQGKSLINTILDCPSKDTFTILALTRNTDSAAAKALAAKASNIKLVRGDLDDVPGVFKAALEATGGEKIWGVFSVQQAVQSGWTPEREMKQGKDMVDKAVESGVEGMYLCEMAFPLTFSFLFETNMLTPSTTVFVYTSADRGANSDSNPTYVPHFASKHTIETYLKEKTISKPITYTILRPTAFMDNLTPDFFGKCMATWVQISLQPSKKLAFIATSDIGFFAAQAFLHPENPEYKRQAISLAGDELTMGELREVFQKRMGYQVPTTYEFVGRFVKWMLTEINIMFRWFDEEGFTADIGKLKRMHPGLMDFGEWLEKESGFPVKK